MNVTSQVVQLSRRRSADPARDGARVRRLLRALKAWYRRRATRLAIEQLDEWQLKDIGFRRPPEACRPLPDWRGRS